MSPASRSAVESESLEFTIETSRPFPQLVFFTLLYTTDTAEVTGPNFDPGAGRPQVVRLPANDTSVTFTVPVAEDLIVESDETFTMTLDDDLPPPPVRSSATPPPSDTLKKEAEESHG